MAYTTLGTFKGTNATTGNSDFTTYVTIKYDPDKYNSTAFTDVVLSYYFVVAYGNWQSISSFAITYLYYIEGQGSATNYVTVADVQKSYDIVSTAGTYNLKTVTISVPFGKKLYVHAYVRHQGGSLKWYESYIGGRSASSMYSMSAGGWTPYFTSVTASGTPVLPTSYTVAYNLNGGDSGCPSSQTKIQDKTITLSTTTPVRSGYSFISWNTASGGGGTSYSPGATYSANANATLYAQWSKNAPTTATLAFNFNGGHDSSGNTTKSSLSLAINTAVGSVFPTVTRDDYQFEGWVDSDGCPWSTTRLMPSTGSTAIALWRKYYSVAVYKNGKWVRGIPCVINSSGDIVPTRVHVL